MPSKALKAFPLLLTLLAGCASAGGSSTGIAGAFPNGAGTNRVRGGETGAASSVSVIDSSKTAASKAVSLPNQVSEQWYRVETNARIERDSAGTKELVEMRTSARVSLSVLRDSQQTGGSGVVSSFAVEVVENGNVVPQNVVFPSTVPFEYLVNAAQIRVAVRPALDNECDRAETGATSLVRDLLVRLPSELFENMRWSDSSASFVCRSGVPIVIRSINKYEVTKLERRNNGVEVVVNKTADIQIEGKLVAAWRARSVRGSGVSSQSFRIDGNSGALIGLEGLSKVIFDINGERVTQQLEQRVSKSSQ